MSEKIVVEVNQDSVLARHIADLQRVITKKNKIIAELEVRLTGQGESSLIEREKKRAYSAGYKKAAGNLMESSRKFADILNNLNSQAFSVYLEGDRLGWEKSNENG